MEQHSIGVDGTMEKFEKPLFQTFGMFIGMLFAFPIHWLFMTFHVKFPGYSFPDRSSDGNLRFQLLESGAASGSTSRRTATEKDALLSLQNKHTSNVSSSGNESSDNEGAETMKTPLWMYFFLAIPSVFDLLATALCMCGLTYLNVSIYQMLRGSGIVFVALMKQNVLGHHLQKFQWIGVFWNVVSVFLVGATAMLASMEGSVQETPVEGGGGEAIIGVLFVLAGAFVQALQFVFEEKVMSMEESVPPLFLIGMEGVWGTLMCTCLLYPLAYFTPGTDHGSYEDPFNTIVMIRNSTAIQGLFVLYFFTIFAYNLLAVLVTFMLNSVWHAILDNFRPITVWGVDLVIYYLITQGTLGESWTRWSFLQLAGMTVLLYGTAIYNAPNAGSLKLEGQWWALGINLSSEYREIESQQEEEELEARWEELRRKAVTRTLSSPKMSVHTLSLRGSLGSPKI